MVGWMAIDFDKECFFIAPIGDDDSKIRKRSNDVRDWVVAPAAKQAADLETIRADDVGEPGQITAQAVQHCLKAAAAVADLTGGNPNVYYELSVRHGAQLPVVLIAEEGTKLPFDISQSRVIFFDHTDLSSAGKATKDLQAQIAASLTGTPDNPISDGMRLAELQAGNVEEQTLALVMDRLQRLSHTTEQIDARLRRDDRRAETRRAIMASPPRGKRWQDYLLSLPGTPSELSQDEMRELLLERQMEDDPPSAPSAPDEGDFIQFEGDDGQGSQGEDAAEGKIGRNDPCWCGSGKRYKKCHGA